MSLMESPKLKIALYLNGINDESIGDLEIHDRLMARKKRSFIVKRGKLLSVAMADVIKVSGLELLHIIV